MGSIIAKLADFQNGKLKGPGVPETCADLLGEGLAMLGVIQVRSRRADMPEERGMGFEAKQDKQPVSRLTALTKCL